MYTIYQNTEDEGLGFESFQNRMIQICNEHRKLNRALAFAFILYDFENPHLFKILNDREYWLALNEISDKYLTVFSLNYNNKKSIRRSLKRNSRSFKMLTDISTEFNPSIGINILIKKYFGNNVKIKYPAILFFQVDNNSVIDSLLVELKEEEIEKGFLELKSFIKKAVSSLKNIAPENSQNFQEVFNCLEREVKSAETVIRIKRITKNAGEIIGLISSIKGIFLN